MARNRETRRERALSSAIPRYRAVLTGSLLAAAVASVGWTLAHGGQVRQEDTPVTLLLGYPVIGILLATVQLVTHLLWSRSAGEKPGRRAPRMPWPRPLWAYVVGWLVALAAAAFASEADGGMPYVVLGIAVIFTGLSWLMGGLLALVFVICGFGIVMFTRMALSSVDEDGRPVEPWMRVAALSCAVATAGVVLVVVGMVGFGGYESPHRRDIWPTIGLVRDDVTVTRPGLLLFGQVCSISGWLCLVGGFVGYQLARLTGRGPRRGRPGRG